MKPAELQDVAEVCKMLSDSTRLSIVVILAKGPKPVMALCDALKMTQPTVSYHLGLLRNQRLVDRKRKGKAQIYSLNRGKLEPARKFLAKMR
jgi:DNA-binding transcriptional ArsR family regulator